MLRKSMRDMMASIRMKVVKPSRRPHYVVRWTDPQSGKPREKSTGKRTKRDALHVAVDLAGEIAEGGLRNALGWVEFCRLYEVEHLAHKSAKTAESWHTTRRWVAELMQPRALQQVDARFLSRWQHRLRARGVAEATVGVYSRHLRAALNWAETTELLEAAPKIRIPKGREARGREVRGEEFERMLMAAEQERPQDAPAICRFMRGLYMSGFRLDELRVLSWDTTRPLALDTTGTLPVVRICRESQKGRRITIQPITPEFWTLCCEMPAEGRTGWVFPLRGSGGQMNVKTIGRIISRIGRRAGVLVDPETGKCATAHDLRRSFCCNMDGRLTLAELQKWMRHRDIGTTMRYYHQKDAEQLAAKVWQPAHGKGGALGGAPD